MRSLRGLIVCEDPDLRARIHELLVESGEVYPELALQRFPQYGEAARHLNLCRPEVVLVAIDCLREVVDFIGVVETIAPGAAVIAVSRLQDSRALGELMRLGVRDCVAAPLNRVKFLEAIHRIAYQLNERSDQAPNHPVVCFLPSRPGSGTSTLACNVSFRMSSLPGAEVLLADLDSSAGVSRFLFKLGLTASLGDLADVGHAVNDYRWIRCVMRADNLHVIQGGLRPRQYFLPHHMHQFVEFACAHYNAICVDLTGGMESYALELLRRSSRILLVSTVEPASIELTREKVQLLTTLDLYSRTRVLLTIGGGAPAPNVAELSAYLGAPIDGVFDFADKRVRKCIGEGSLIDLQTAVGRTIERYSKDLREQLKSS